MPIAFGDPQSIKARDLKPNARDKQMRLPPAPPSQDRSPMTDEDKDVLTRLLKCKLAWNGWDDNFIKDMRRIATANGEITDRQRWHLWRLVHRYRRQIKDETLVGRAVEFLAS